MSKARNNPLYRQIQSALEEIFPVADIEKALSPIFDQVAIASIDSEDIFVQARRLAIPMDDQGVSEILNALEINLTQEESLNLDAVNDRIQAWFDDTDWETLPRVRMRSLQTDFLFVLAQNVASFSKYNHLPKSSYLLACKKAEKLAQETGQLVEVLAIDPNLDLSDLESVLACSHYLCTVEGKG